MKWYELLCVLPGTLGEDEVAPAVVEVKTLLAGQGATNISSEDKGKNRLAYPIKHIRYGYSMVMAFQAEPSALPAIQAKLRLVTQVLRAMINEFDPVARKKKDLVLAKLARERAEYEKPRMQAQDRGQFSAEPVGEAVAVAKAQPIAVAADEPVVATATDKPVKRSKKTSTEKPTEENMSAIEEKLDKVLDSTLEEV